MMERARKYGILTEIRELAKWLGLAEVDLENPGKKYYPLELVQTLGVNRKAPVKEGDTVPKWKESEETTTVKAVLKDLLNNEAWITEFTYERHIPKTLQKKRISLQITLSDIKEFLKNPDQIYWDTVDGAFLFVREKKGKRMALVVGEHSRKIFTIMPIRTKLSSKRYKLLFEEKK